MRDNTNSNGKSAAGESCFGLFVFVSHSRVLTDKAKLTPAQKRQLRLMKELGSDRVDVQQPEEIIKSSIGTLQRRLLSIPGAAVTFSDSFHFTERGDMRKVAKVFSAIEEMVPLRPKPFRKRNSQQTPAKRVTHVSETDSNSTSSISADDIDMELSLSTGTITKAIRATNGKSNKRDFAASSSSSGSSDDESSDSGEAFTYELLQSVPDIKRLRKIAKIACSETESSAEKDDNDNEVVIVNEKKAQSVAKRMSTRADRRPPTPPRDLEVVVLAATPVNPTRMASFNMTMLQRFAFGKPIKTAFVDRVLACAEIVDDVSVDIANICHTDFEETVFYALMNAVVPMRFSGSSLVNEVRETLTVEQAEAMRVICERLQLPYDLYVTRNYIVPCEDFMHWAFRPVAWGWDGALSFNINTGKARFWMSSVNRFAIGKRSWASLTLPIGSPMHMYADGASEFGFKYDAASKTVTLLGSSTIDEIQLVRQGDDFLMRCGDVSVPLRNGTLLKLPTAAAPAPSVDTAAAVVGGASMSESSTLIE